MYRYKKNTRRLTLYVFFIAVLVGCGGSSSDGENSISHSDNNLSVRFAISRAFVAPLITDLQARVALSDGASSELNVNKDDNTVSGNLMDVQAGVYDLTITYYVIQSSVEVLLATVTKTVTVVAGASTQFSVNNTDLNRNLDDDGDGYTNLAEVRSGSSALDRSEMPPGEPPTLSVGTGSFGNVSSANFTIKSRLGEMVNGSATSENFQILAGFRSY